MEFPGSGCHSEDCGCGRRRNAGVARCPVDTLIKRKVVGHFTRIVGVSVTLVWSTSKRNEFRAPDVCGSLEWVMNRKGAAQKEAAKASASPGDLAGSVGGSFDDPVLRVGAC